MPIVDYNRIYKVRSRERQPALYSPHMIPDAAGAYLRASGPGIRARLDDAEARARERQGNLRAQFAALGNLIGVGAKVGDAYARAVERRNDADFNALAAAWENHMNNGADAAFNARRESNGNGGWTGPSVSIRDLDRSFDETDAFTSARAGVKERFQKWRAEHSQSYFRKADKRQADLADAYRKQAFEDKWSERKRHIANLYDPDDAAEWIAEVDKAVPEMVSDTVAVNDELGNPAMSAAQIAGMERDLRTGMFMERWQHWCNLYAASDAPADESQLLEMEWAALSPEEREKQKDKFSTLADWQRYGVPDLDDAQRFALKKQVDAAKESRGRNHAESQGKIAHEADSIIDSIRFGDVSGADFQTAQAKVRELVLSLDPEPEETGVKLSGGAAKLLDDLDRAVADRELINFATAWNGAASDTQKDELTKKLRDMPDGRAKDAIKKWMYGGVAGGSASGSITPTKVGNLCVRDINNPYSPRQVHEMVVEQFMRDGDLVKLGESISKIRSFMNFRSATGENATRYLESIGESLGNAFGADLGNIFKIGKDGLPVFDKDGNPVPAEGFNPNGMHATRLGEKFEPDATGQSFGWTSGGLTISNRTLQEGYRLGMEYIVQRLSGFDGKGGRPSKALPAITPETVKADLSEYFKTAIPDMGDMLTDHILAQTILDMRQKSERLGVDQYLLDKARRAYFDKQAGVATGGIDDKEISDQ